MLVTEAAEGIGRKQRVRALGFLEAEDVRLVFGQEPLNERQAQPYGVDVPGGEGGHERSE
jgi:hypothetical protein